MNCIGPDEIPGDPGARPWETSSLGWKTLSRHISDSMQEQKIGMEHTANAVIQVRDASTQLAGVMDTLTSLMGRFKTRGSAEYVKANYASLEADEGIGNPTPVRAHRWSQRPQG